jgi:rhamnosyltransferase subunit B
MHALLLPIGSAGDVHPFIGLGLELRRRGHRVTVLCNAYFEELICKTGLEFAPLGTTEEFRQLLDHPDLWNPWRSFELIYRHGFLPVIPKIYEFIQQHFVPSETVVVASSLAFGARIAQEKFAIPTVSVHLQPSVFRSVYDTPVYPSMNMGSQMPRVMKRLLFRWIDWYIDRIIAPEINAFRHGVGLPPVKRLFNGWLESPECVLGFFPDWFAPPQPDWPSQTHLVGFPLYDAFGVEPLPEGLETFLRAGEPPITFTAGSAMKQGRWFFEESVKACQQLGHRALLINKFRDQVPDPLPKSMFYAHYAPFSQVFPRSRIVVHHGGIGTTAQVFAAGVPQLVMPLAFDQPDQAARVERLGVGGQIARRNYRADKVANALRTILRNPLLDLRAKTLSPRNDGPRSLAQACDWVERTFSEKKEFSMRGEN